ncbi:MAG: 4-alpha-glucanotransferase [Lentimicrobium sp.]|nr:4-alpha-glucanotransferase [Lentimicrobium sp.]
MNKRRQSGILLHPTSLPGEFGIGNFGPEAFKFIDFLAEAGQSLWQILPLGPTGPGDSPYQSFSAFALNPVLIDLNHFVFKGLIHSEVIHEAKCVNTGMVDYAFVNSKRDRIFRLAYESFLESAPDQDRKAFDSFCLRHRLWLDDYALFMAIKDYFGGIAWHQWPLPIRKREAKAMRGFSKMLKWETGYHRFLQFVVNCQWLYVKSYANDKKVSIIGDIPLYVSFDSSDAWARPEMFMLDKKLRPVMVAGVPPDFFSETGQLWGNPVYDWDYQKRTGFKWWIQRMEYNLELANIIRIDHFRGLAAYWAVPFGAENAIEGEWLPAPGDALFTALTKKTGSLPIIAEDLGVITPDVDELRDKFGLPGMKILQFGFDKTESNPYLPHFYTSNSVVYTGTHDNDTVMGWYKLLDEEDKKKFHEYSGCSGCDVHWQMIRMSMASVSDIAVIPLQDVFGLGSEARMNIPGTPHSNWQWRFKKGDIKSEHKDRLKLMTVLYDR